MRTRRFCLAVLSARFVTNAVILFSMAVLLSETVMAGGVEKEIMFEFDRGDHLYSCGETTAATVTVITEAGDRVKSGILDITLTNDGRMTLGRYVFNLAEANPAEIRAKLDFPGFLQFRAEVREDSSDNHPTTQLAAVGFSPEKITPALPEPDDFEAFLEAGREKVREVPIDVKMTRLDDLSSDKLDIFSVSFATIDNRRVYGYLSVPKTAGGPPYPALVHVPGHGSGMGPDFGNANQGFVALNLNVLPYAVPQEKEKRAEPFEKFVGELGMDYGQLHREDRDAYYFRALFLGMDRAIDWLAEQDYVDAGRIGYVGSSQGGGTGLILCGMNRHLSIAVLGVPAFGDQGAGTVGRSPGWPKVVDNADGNPAVLSAARYIDAVNYARRIQARVTLTVGFFDTACPPSSVYAAFNVIPARNKIIINEPEAGHQTGTPYLRALDEMKAKLIDNQTNLIIQENNKGNDK